MSLASLFSAVSRVATDLERTHGMIAPSGVFFPSENVNWIAQDGWQQRERDTDTQGRGEAIESLG